MNQSHKTIRNGLLILGAIILCTVIFCLVLIVTEYKPDSVETLTVEAGSGSGTSEKSLSIGETFSLVTWNIGYGCLGANADFFMDGGKSVNTATKDQVLSNMDAITSKLKELSPDIILLQEVDERSSRSHKINEMDMLRKEFPGYCNSFAYNYKCLMVPYPIPPIGEVASGIMTLSTFPVESAQRIQLPCPFSFPIRVANLKRCLLVSRIPVENSDKELVIINLHLEAYDSGEGKAAQTQMLAQILQTEASLGNYVIAGGDFNQTFSNTDTSAYPLQGGDLWTPGSIDTDDLGTSFSCVTDSSSPTCRSLDKPYEGHDDDFQYYVIDGFVVSSNVNIHSVETLNLDFQNSDHNPLRFEVELN